jgi:hypothetical protein
MIHQIIKAFDRSCLPMTGSWVVYIANEQITRNTEQMKFNSLNEVSSKFIDVANGDSQKYADLVSNFDEHVRESRLHLEQNDPLNY